MKRKFVIEKGNIDCHGNKIDISGLNIAKDKYPLLKDFDANKPIGNVKVYIENNVVMAEGDIPDISLGMYPAVGVKVVKEIESKGMKRTTITRSDLISVSLSNTPNADPDIFTI